MVTTAGATKAQAQAKVVSKGLLKHRLSRNLKIILQDLKKYDPDKVILFGSCARGEHSRDSDIDVLIIKQNPGKKRVVDRIGEVLSLLSISGVEPIVLTPAEVQSRIKWGDFFTKEIIEEGQVIYERRKVS